MFRQRNMLVRFPVPDGMHVLARGRVSLYEPRGEYQVIVDHIEEAGEGALRRRFELLKQKLRPKACSTRRTRRRCRTLPRRIGVVTSPTGAAIRDILHILRRRFPAIPVLIYPVPVQGEAPPRRSSQAMRLARRARECDVLILARGGGSLEDLWAFNEEGVARAIYDCAIPIVTGIGHEVDFTIADFVADVRAPTPSGAAERVVPDRAECLRALGVVQRHVVNAMRRRLQSLRARRCCSRERGLRAAASGCSSCASTRSVSTNSSSGCSRMRARATASSRACDSRWRVPCSRAVHPARRVAQANTRLAASRNAALARSPMHRRAAQMRTRAADRSLRTLDAVSPLATLERGYAIVTDDSGRCSPTPQRASPALRSRRDWREGRCAQRCRRSCLQRLIHENRSHEPRVVAP